MALFHFIINVVNILKGRTSHGTTEPNTISHVAGQHKSRTNMMTHSKFKQLFDQGRVFQING